VKRKDARLCLFDASEKGVGVMCKRDIMKDAFLAEYTGEMLNQDLWRDRMATLEDTVVWRTHAMIYIYKRI
jgi:hypothetical protein